MRHVMTARLVGTSQLALRQTVLTATLANMLQRALRPVLLV